MKIACLQFAPQVGDVNNNLNRADAVLAKANPDDLLDLDLIVLPELAFTGYSFKSLNEISPFLEPQGSGISALWARTTALKYDTNVIVGYPERVDVSAKWPTGPEYYSSAIVVNGDGETIANYRKSFLYAIDETWALEGEQGFFAGDLPGLGSTAMGICMDLNPYRFEAPWSDFEFAYHVQAVEANLVIVSMAWLTREDGRHFTRMPEDPDTETLTYWVQRLEPLIRSEGQGEIIVVFCNRTGIEGEVVYAGTSSVVGIKDGEVKVYGILGSGVKDLLVVDTENGPFAKLIQQPEADGDSASQVSGMSRRPRKPAAAKPLITSTGAGDLSLRVDARDGQRRATPTPEDNLNTRKTRLNSPRIQIPDSTFYKSRAVSHGTPIDESPGVATPTCPSPTPLRVRPNVNDLETETDIYHTDADDSHAEWDGHGPHICEGRVSIEPPNPSTASPTSGKLSEKYFWSDTQGPLKSPMAFRFPDVYKQDISKAETPVPSALVKLQREERFITDTLFEPAASASFSHTSELSRLKQSEQSTDCKHVATVVKYEDAPSREFALARPESPKSRNASRTGRPLSRRYSEVEQPDLSGTVERLESMAARPDSAAQSVYYGAEEPRLGRARVRKSSMNATDQAFGTPQVSNKRIGIVSPSGITMVGSPGMSSDTTAEAWSGSFKNSEKTAVRPSTATGTVRPCPRAGTRSRNRSGTAHSASLSQTRFDGAGHTRVLRNAESHIEPDETRTIVWSEFSKMVGEVLGTAPQTRNVSRGRHRLSGHFTSSSAPIASRETHSETRSNPRVIPRAEQRFASQVRSGSVDQAPIRTILASAGTEGPSTPPNPDDEIVAEIIFHSQSRPSQLRMSSTQGRTNKASPTPPAGAPTKSASSRTAESGQRRVNSRRSASQQSTTQQQRFEYSRSRSIQRKCPSAQDSATAKVDISKARDGLKITNRTESNESCPTMDGESILTISPQKSSPGTPPARSFEPTTPKAMKFDHEFAKLLSANSKALSDGATPQPDSLQRELMRIGILRPKSVIW